MCVPVCVLSVMCVYPGVFMSVCIYVCVLCLHVVDRGLIWLSFSTALWLFSKTFLWKWVFCLHVCMCINCVLVSAKVRRSYWIPGSGVTNAGERTLFPGNWVWVFSAAAASPQSHLSSCKRHSLNKALEKPELLITKVHVLHWKKTNDTWAPGTLEGQGQTTWWSLAILLGASLPWVPTNILSIV